MFAQSLQALVLHNARREKYPAELAVCPRVQIVVARERHTVQPLNSAVPIRTALMHALQVVNLLRLHPRQPPKLARVLVVKLLRLHPHRPPKLARVLVFKLAFHRRVSRQVLLQMLRRLKQWCLWATPVVSAAL
jgi:hypothetical protein